MHNTIPFNKKDSFAVNSFDIMNIMFYMPTVLIGGVRTVTEILSDGFRKRGHNVKWLLLYRKYEDLRDYPEGEDCTYLPSSDLMSEDNIEFYRKFVSSNKIDVIINQNGLYEGVDLIDSLEDKFVTRISVLHNNPAFHQKWLFNDALTLRDSTIKEKFKRIARILLFPLTKHRFDICLKEHYKKLLYGGSHVNVLSPNYIGTVRSIEDNICNISSIANPNTYTSITTKPKEKTLLYVGRLYDRSKKISELLKIWRNISDRNPEWKLQIVGEGPDEEWLIRQANHLDRVEFLGYQDPRPYYETASIICMTSIFEGFPMVLTEAMQHGCIPIAYDSFPAIYDIINDGEDGIIIKAFDRDMYERKLNYLMHDKDARRSMSERAKKNIHRFDREIIIDQWEDLITRLKNEQ